MPRRRINDGLPKYVRRRSYGVIFTPYRGRENGRTVWGKDINLGPADMSVPEIWHAYHRETKQDHDTLRWLLNEYHQSPKFRSLKPKTQTAYEDYKAALLEYPMASGKEFGTAPLDKIKRTALQKLIDKHHAATLVNRWMQYLKSVWNWGLNRYDHVPPNPCIGLELRNTPPRDRYVTPEEYAKIHALATGWVHWAMELAYLCRARRVEIVNLRINDIQEEGLRLVRAKGSEGEITKWTPRLYRAVKGALDHSYGDVAPIGNARILLNNFGSPITDSAWNSALGRLRPKMRELGMEPFTLHDLKASGYSDQVVQDAGHRSERMHSIYSRKLRVVVPAE